ncbi:uncharacterized protein LOC143288736 [Babylonia areolata]|uniref:uncharacterized protein LOC143288736 n=1 Tax=Babylonia areolata TaxID=304850 RepID=UPI003FD3039E
MEGLNIVFPFSVCQDLVENEDGELWCEYKASVSMGAEKKSGPKTNGSLQARVVSSEAGKMVDFVVLFPRMPVTFSSGKKILHCRIENLQKCDMELCWSQNSPEAEQHWSTADCENEADDTRGQEPDDTQSRGSNPSVVDHGVDQNNEEGNGRSSHPKENPVQNKESVKLKKAPCLSSEKEKTAEADSETVDSVQVTSAISNSDHGYSLLVQERASPSPHGRTHLSPQQTQTKEQRVVKNYDELIRKLKHIREHSQIEAGIIAHTVSSKSTDVSKITETAYAVSPERMTTTNWSSSSSLLMDGHYLSSNNKEDNSTSEADKLAYSTKGSSGFIGITSDHTKKDSATGEASPQEVCMNTQKRFAPKYDRLIKNLKMASERSGLEMLSVLSGFSYKLDHDARAERMGGNHDAKAEQRGSNYVTAADSSPSGQSATSQGVRQAQGEESVSSSIQKKDKSRNFVSNKTKSIAAESSTTKTTNSTVTSTGKSTSIWCWKSQPDTQQISSHLTSFPRKFPSCLTRTDIVDVFVSKAGHSRKRLSSSPGTLAGATTSKYVKTNNTEKLISSVSDMSGKSMAQNSEPVERLSETGKETSGQRYTNLMSAESVVADSHSSAGKTLTTVASTTDQTGQPRLKAQRGVPGSFFLPVVSSAVSSVTQTSQTQPQNKVLVGPFKLLDHRPGMPKILVPNKGGNSKPFSLPRTSSTPSPSTAQDNGDPRRTDHDYTNLVYDKNAPSSRALKTLVKPISLSQHIDARVERVEEGDGSSLVTIRGHNTKAAGGLRPLDQPSLALTKEGMPIARTLDDVLTVTIRCREIQQQRHQQALTARRCQPVRVEAGDIPVVREVVVTPTGSPHTPARKVKARRSCRQNTPMLQCQSCYPHTSHTADDQNLSLLFKGDTANRKQTVTKIVLQMNQSTVDKDSVLQMNRSTVDKNSVLQMSQSTVDKERETVRSVCEERTVEGLRGTRLQPWDHMTADSRRCCLSQQGVITDSGAVDSRCFCRSQGIVTDSGAVEVDMVTVRQSEQEKCNTEQEKCDTTVSPPEQEKCDTTVSDTEQKKGDTTVCMGKQGVTGDMVTENKEEAILKQGVTGDVVIENEEEVILKQSVTGDVVIENEEEAMLVSARMCRYCLKMFHTALMLYKHVKKAHTAFNTWPQHQLYLQSLKKDSQVKCPLCPHTFLLSNQYHLKAHLVSCHGAPHSDLLDSSPVTLPALCEVCQIHFHRESELRAHATLVHDCEVVPCAHCPLVFVTKDTRAKHMSVAHGDNTACPFLCRLCDAAFHTREHLRCHKQEHRSGHRPGDTDNTRALASTPPKWRTKSRGPLRCPPTEFTDHVQPHGHRRRGNTGPSPVPVHCIFCGVGLRTLSAMNTHLRTHLSPCPMAGRTTQLQCPWCEHRVWPRRAFLMLLHMARRHQDHLPFRCSLCSLSFALDTALHTHLSQAHPLPAGLSAAGVSAGSADRVETVQSAPLSVTPSTTPMPSALSSDLYSVTQQGRQPVPSALSPDVHGVTQGRQAVVTINTEKRGMQKIVFTPSQALSASDTSHTLCDLSAVGMYMPSDPGAIVMADPVSAAGCVALWDGLMDTPTQHDSPHASPVVVGNCSPAVSVDSSVSQKAEVLLDYPAQFSSRQSVCMEEEGEGVGEMSVIEEGVMVEGVGEEGQMSVIEGVMVEVVGGGDVVNTVVIAPVSKSVLMKDVNPADSSYCPCLQSNCRSVFTPTTQEWVWGGGAPRLNIQSDS